MAMRMHNDASKNSHEDLPDFVDNEEGALATQVHKENDGESACSQIADENRRAPLNLCGDVQLTQLKMTVADGTDEVWC